MATHQIILPFNHGDAEFREAVRAVAGTDEVRILKRSIDARQHRAIRVQYAVSTDLRDPADETRALIAAQRLRVDALRQRLAQAGGTLPRPVIVGSGPGGLFSALWLHRHGIAPVLVEQGPPMRERVRDMARFMKQGVLDPYSNISFGAGGAGTYSDGKLITRIRSPYIAWVMDVFTEFGAPADIRFVYNPHLGSNIIRQCITRLLDRMEAEGVDVRYRTRFTDIDGSGDGASLRVGTTRGEIPDAAALFLATGHSSRETYALLRARGVAMDVKEFAIGLRIEHTARAINDMQYGAGHEARYPGIETAQYRLAHTWKEDARAVYSFCMCPGGYVLNASTSVDGVVTNGMSNARKGGRFSNAALVVNVSRADLEREGFTGIDGALALQMDVEARFRASVNAPGACNIVPAQRLGDFLAGSHTRVLGAHSCANPVASADLHALLPDFIAESLRRGIARFDHTMRGFASSADAQLFGLESRTSSPYRIERDAVHLTSPTHPLLYPVGEGAGFAGGITSAAVDGIRCAQAWLASIGCAEAASVSINASACQHEN